MAITNLNPVVRSLLAYMGTTAFLTLTFPYYVRLQNTTLQPIRQIIAGRGDEATTIKRISKFVTGKEQELGHVRVASTLSAAATIGVFSWPEVAETYWVARSLWFIAMMLSFFSLISSHQARLLEGIPNLGGLTSAPESVERAIHLITWTPRTANGQRLSHPRRVSAELTLRNIVVIYVWQSALMQMSWAWVLFLVGLTLHVIRSLLPRDTPPAEKRVAIIFLVFTSLLVLNFLGTGTLLHFILKDSEPTNKREATNIGSHTDPTTTVSEVENGDNFNAEMHT